MPRGRLLSFNDDFLAPETAFVDSILASSWPAAVPPSRLAQPPRAPLRKPSTVNWDVPPMTLPVAPKRSSFSGSGSTADELCPVAFQEDDDEASEDEDTCVFALEGMDGGVMDDELCGTRNAFQELQLDGFDDTPCGDVSSPRTSGFFNSLEGTSPFERRSRSDSASPSLGASPVLMSVLEQVAVEAQQMGSSFGAKLC